MERLKHLFRIFFPVAGMIVLFILPGLAGQLAAFTLIAVLALASPYRAAIFAFFLKLSSLLLITLAVHLFFRFGEPDYFSAFGGSALWIRAGFYTLRNANILFIMSYTIRNGAPVSFASLMAFLERRGPSRLVQPLALAVRYVSLIRDEFQSLRQVHRIMGIRRPKHLAAQIRYYTSLIVPTIISSLERAENLSLAMTSRGFNR